MSKVYKVWAKGCIRPKGKRIERIDEAAVFCDAIDELLSEAFERKVIDYYNGDELNEGKYNDYFIKAVRYFNEHKVLNFGDYQIIKVDDDVDVSDIQIPDCCHSDISIFKEDNKTVCHCNLKENAELIAKILDYDVNNEVYPKKEVNKMTNENNFNLLLLSKMISQSTTEKLKEFKEEINNNGGDEFKFKKETVLSLVDKELESRGVK